MGINQSSFRFVVSSAIIASLSAGLSSQAFAFPHIRMVKSSDATASGNCIYPDGKAPTDQPEIHCYEPKQFLAAYGIDKLHDMGITGKGQTIILADSFGSPTMQNDLDVFSDKFGLPRTKVQFIYPNGPYTNDLADSDKAGWAGETTLDLEWAHAIAPDATLVNIVTNTSETVGLAGFPDLFKGFQMAIKQYPGSIISMSFGTGEPTFTDSDITNYLRGSFHQILEEAVAADITLLASSGDQGSTNLDKDQKTLIGYANASYPASDPLITAVGGTALQAGWKWTPQGTADDYWACKLAKLPNCPKDFLAATPVDGYVGETVWKEDWAFAASGGGVSTIFDAPDYQSSIGSAPLAIMKGKRGLPDTAMNAAINGGVEIYTSYVAPLVGAMGPTWSSTGGTSCASPETAALIALAGQKASDDLGRPVGIGYLNPILYSLADSDFNDVVSQTIAPNVSIDNDAVYFSAATHAAHPKSTPPVAVPGYFTTPGFDLVTGRGSPNAPNFVLDVARAREARPEVIGSNQ
jgi:subtilase family serine protease